MNKTELVEAIASKTELTKKSSAVAVSAIVEAVTETLVKGDKVTLVGFGTFEVVKRKARTGHNPATGAKIKIPAAKSPKFKAGKALKEAVNKGKKK